MASANGILTRIINYLQVPIGARYKKSSVDTTNTAPKVTNDLLDSIVDITSDDVCIGLRPIYYKTTTEDGELLAKLDKFVEELNKVAKWIAVDLLSVGHSVFVLRFIKSKTKLTLTPVIGELRYLLTSDGTTKVFDADDKEIKNALIFINYTKSSLTPTENPYEFTITPMPIQLKNVDESVRYLAATETSMVKFRREMSRLLRFVTVDVGSGLLDRNQDLVDSVSSAINANSQTLEVATSDLFEDEIPVFPHRGTVGKPTVEESIPNVSFGETPDLDHFLSKVFMITRFPKTYADFNQSLDTTAVSLIRTDIRYARVVRSCRNAIEAPLNNLLSTIPAFKNAGIKFYMVALPSPEDEDAISALSGYMDFLSPFYEFITNSADISEANHKLKVFESLLGEGAATAAIQEFLKALKKATDSFYADKTDEESNDSDRKPFTPKPKGESFDLDKDLEVDSDQDLEVDSEPDTSSGLDEEVDTTEDIE